MVAKSKIDEESEAGANPSNTPITGAGFFRSFFHVFPAARPITQSDEEEFDVACSLSMLGLHLLGLRILVRCPTRPSMSVKTEGWLGMGP